MANVEIKITGYNDVLSGVSAIAQLFNNKRLLDEIGMFIITTIKLRTAEGDDVNGKMFEPYSNDYALFREKQGRPTSPPDLFFTGSMMSSMDFNPNVLDSSVRAFFQNTTDREGASNPLKAAALNEDREFFALSKSEIEDITRIVMGYMDKLWG